MDRRTCYRTIFTNVKLVMVLLFNYHLIKKFPSFAAAKKKPFNQIDG
jgi:hypothetical protein